MTAQSIVQSSADLPRQGDPLLPEGYTWRPATRADVEITVALQNVTDIQFDGEPHSTPESLLEDWDDAGVDLSADTWLVFAPDQTLVGYILACDSDKDGDMDVDWFVHKDHLERGIGEFLLTKSIEHLRQYAATYPAEQRKRVHGTTYHVDSAGIAAYQALGFTHVRSYYRMSIDLPEPPVVTSVPDGITIRPLDPDRDLPEMHAAVTEAFSEHWGFTALDYDEWYRMRIASNFFRLDLSLVAVEDATGKIIGAANNRVVDIASEGWVNGLAVLKPYRGKGLARAILTRSFQNFYNVGLRKAGLGVDAENHTGATQLYLGVGMRIAGQYDTYELVL